MAEFGIAIKIDPGNSKSGIDGLNDALTKLETTGAKVNERMRDSKGRFSDTAAGAKQAGEALSGLSEEQAEFERMVLLGNVAKAAEEAMLKKLIGPMRELEREMELINSLHDQGAIKTDVFTAAIAKRNQALARMEGGGKGFDSTAGQQFGPVFDSSKAGAGGGGAGAGGGIGGLASTLGVGIGVGSIVAGAKALFEANEAYERLENTVRKFQATGESATQTVDRMRDIQDVMRASLADTIGLYDRVTVATRDLYLTQQQQVQITESIGLISKESNVDIGTTEAVLKKLAYAAESGTLSTRELRSTFTQLPAVLDILKSKYGENEKGILAMAAQGKIGPRDIFLAVQEYLPQAQEKIGDYTKSGSERLSELANSIINAGRNHDKWVDTVSRGGADVVAAEDRMAEAAKRGELQTKRWADAMEGFAKVAKDVKEALEHLTDGNYQLKLRLDDYTNSIGAAQIKLKLLQDQKQAFLATPSLGAADPGFSRKLDDDIAKQKLIVDAMKNSVPQAAVDVGTKRIDYTSEVEALTIAEHNEALTAQQRIDAHTALIEVEKKHAKQLAGLRSEVEKMEDKLLKPFQQYKLELVAIADLQQRMPQYADVWAEELDKINAKNPGFLLLEATIKRHVVAYDAAAKAAAAWREAQGYDPGLNAPGLLDASGNGSDDPMAHAGGGVRFGADQLRDASAARAGLAVGQPTLDKIEELNEKLRASYQELTEGSAQKFTDQMVKYGQDLENGVIPSQDEYNQLVKKLHDQYNDMKTPQEVFAQGVKDATDKLDAGIYSIDAFEKKLRQLREAAGQGTFGDGFDSFVDNLKKQSEDSKASLDLLNAGFGSLNSGIMNLIESKGSLADWGASFASTMAKVAEQALATQLLLSLIGLGAPQSIETSLANSIFGVPGHASGAYYPPGGSGGTDSQFVAFRKSPDEDVLVRTPAQQRAMSGSNGGSAQPAIHLHVPGDRRDLPPPGPSHGEVHIMIRDEVARAMRRR